MLTHFGESAESLQRLRGPIGIYIGSKTPADIAVSVMAEILAVKNGVPLAKEWQVEVAKEAHSVASSSAGAAPCGLPA
jgi:xanthine dehydrogenase accessory factor